MNRHRTAGAALRFGTLGFVAWLVLCAPLSAEEPKPRAVFEGHTDSVEALVFSPDGKTLASGSHDHSIKLWDLATGKNTATFEEKDPNLWQTVAFSPDGKTLATGGWFGKVKLWNLGTLKGKILLDVTNQCPPPVVVFSPDGKTLAAGGVCRNEMQLIDVATGKSKAALVTHKEGNPEGVLALAFSPDGKKLVSVSRDDELMLWDVATGKKTATLKIEEIAHAAAFSPDSKTVAAAVYDKDNNVRSVTLWDTATGKAQTTLKGHPTDVEAVVFSPNGKTLACGCEDGTITLWDIATSKELNAFKGHTEKIRCLAFSPDGTVLASGSEDKIFKLWDVEKAK
jgi:WD40 repeat protein